MAFVLFEGGAFKVVVKYVERRGNTYYFRRRIPNDVRHLYPGKNGVLFWSLETSDEKQAGRKAPMLLQGGKMLCGRLSVRVTWSIRPRSLTRRWSC